MNLKSFSLRVCRDLCRDLILAISFFTRIPVKVPQSAYTIKLAEAGWAFPFVGLIIASLVTLAAIALHHLGASPLATTGVVLGLMVLLTGALHEDGLADVADGFGGGHTVSRKLEIMRDSAIGVYGTIALVISLMLRFAFIHELLSGANFWFVWISLSLALMSGRVFMLAAMVQPGELRTGGKGLGHSAGQANKTTAIVWLAVLAAAFCFISILGFIAVLLVAGAARYLVHRQIGGMTGDAYGFIEQVTQVTALAVFASFTL